jgi:hypothetical protein
MPSFLVELEDGRKFNVESDIEPNEDDINDFLNQPAAPAPAPSDNFLGQSFQKLRTGTQQALAGAKTTLAAVGGFNETTGQGLSELAAATQQSQAERTPQDIALQEAMKQNAAEFDAASGFFGKAKEFADYAGIAAMNPRAAFQMGLQSLPNALVSLPAAAAGKAIGAGAGLLAGIESGPGAIATGAAGMALGAIGSNMLMEGGGAIADKINEATGGQSANWTPEQFTAFVQANPGIVNAGLQSGAVRGAIIGGVDAASMGLAGRIIKPAVGSVGRAGKMGRAVAATGLEMASEGGGEALAGYVDKGKVDSEAVAQEILGGIGSGVPTAIVGKGLTATFGKPQTPPPSPATVEDLSENLGDLTADEVADLEPTTPSAPVGANMPADKTAPASVAPVGSTPATGDILPPPATVPPAADLTADPSASPPPGPGLPGDTTAVNLPAEDPASIANIGIRAAVGAGAARSRPVLPASPLGAPDLLDFLNDNPIGGPSELELSNENWERQTQIPAPLRKFITDPKSRNTPEQVAQEAFDNNLIDAPTPDALIAKIAEVAAARESAAAMAKGQQQSNQVNERQAKAFENNQRKLASSNSAAAVAVDDLRPGQTLSIGGTPVTVLRTLTDDEGRNTQVTLDGGADFGQIVLNNEGNFIMADQAPVSPASSPSTTPSSTTPSPSDPFSPSRPQQREQRVVKPEMEGLGLPTEPGSYQNGATLVKRALMIIVGNKSAPETLRMMAKVLLAADLKNLFLRIEGDGRKQYAGQYQAFGDARNQVTAQGEISINTRGHAAGQTVAETLVHEVLHHATYRAVRKPRNSTQTKAIAALEALRTSLQGRPGFSEWAYPLSNIDEFISGLFTLPGFQSWLAQQPAPAGLSSKIKNALAAIFNSLAKLVTGKDVVPGSALDVAFAESLALVETEGQTQDTGPGTSASSPAPLASPTRPPAPEGFDYTKARWASPSLDEQLYPIAGNEEMRAIARDWHMDRSIEQAIDELERQTTGLEPAAVEMARGFAIRRAAILADSKGELQQALGAALLHRAGKLRNEQRRAAAQDLQAGAMTNRELVPFAPVLAANEALIDRADAVMNTRFEGGAAGGAAAVQTVATTAGEQASTNLAEQLDEETAVPVPPPTPEMQAQVTKLQQQLTDQRTTNSYFQEMLDMLRAAGRNAAAVLADTKERAKQMVRQARALAKARADGNTPQQSPTGGQAQPADVTAANAIDPDLARAVAFLTLTESLDFGLFQQVMLAEFGPGVASQIDSLYRQGGQLMRDNVKASAETVKKRVKAADKKKNTKPRAPKPELTEAEKKAKSANKVAESLVNQLALRHSDPTIWPDQKQEHPVRKLYREHLKKPMADFAAKLQALGVTGPESAKLERAASMEIKAQEAYDRIRTMEELTNPTFVAGLLAKLKSKILPGTKWADIFAQLPSDQKARQRAMYERILRDQRLAGLSQAERLELTNALDRAWQQERRKVFQSELRKVGLLKAKDRKDQERVLAAMPKLLRWINLGLMDAAAFRAAIAPEYGLRTMSTADAARLRSMAEAAYQLPEGVLRGKKLAEMLASMQKVTGLSRTEILNSYWTASVLSGLRTQFVIGMAALNGLADIGILSAGLVVTGKGGAALQALGAWGRGFSEALLDCWQIIGKGDYSIQKRFNQDLLTALEAEGQKKSGWRPVPLGETLWRNGNVWSKAPAAVMMFTGRLMAALDHITNTSTTEGAKVVARAMHPELYAAAAPTAAERASARKQALAEVTGGLPTANSSEAATVRARTREILAGVMDKTTYDEASFIGDQSAMQNRPAGIMGAIHDQVSAMFGGWESELAKLSRDPQVWPSARALTALLGALVRPLSGTQFLRAGFNVGNQFLSYMPGTAVVSLVRQAAFAKSESAFNDPFSKSQNALLIGRNVIGFTAAYAIAAAFVGKDDEEEGLHLEGNWQNLTKEQKALRYAAGFEPGTLRMTINGKVWKYNYRDNPLAGILTSVGSAADMRRSNPEKFAQRGVIEHILRGYAAGILQVKDAQAIGTLMETLGASPYTRDPEQGFFEGLAKLPANFAGGLIPTAVKDVAIWSDPRLYKPEGIFEEMLAQVPVLRTQVGGGLPALDRLGNEVDLNRAPWSRFVSSTQDNTARRTLASLMSQGLDIPSVSMKKLIFRDGANVPIESLGPKAVHQYVKGVGKRWSEYLASPDGQALLTQPKGDAQAMINQRDDIFKIQATMDVK